MKQITLSVPETKFKVFLDFVKTLDYVKVKEVDDIAFKELESSLRQVKLMQTGKLPKKSIDQLLDELSN
jgi:hypothetical protein